MHPTTTTYGPGTPTSRSSLPRVCIYTVPPHTGSLFLPGIDLFHAVRKTRRDHLPKCLNAERLREDPDRPKVTGPFLGLLRHRGGQEEDGDMAPRRMRLQTQGDIPTAQEREYYLEEEEIWQALGFVLKRLEDLSPTVDLHDLVPHVQQEVPYQRARVPLAIHDHHARGRSHLVAQVR